jgi:hypothetical protein
VFVNSNSQRHYSFRQTFGTIRFAQFGTICGEICNSERWNLEIIPNRMDLAEKTLTIAIVNPKIRYDFEYEAKGAIFLLPVDTSGEVTVISNEF